MRRVVVSEEKAAIFNEVCAGRDRMINTIRQRFYWHITDDVDNWVDELMSV